MIKVYIWRNKPCWLSQGGGWSNQVGHEGLGDSWVEDERWHASWTWRRHSEYIWWILWSISCVRFNVVFIIFFQFSYRFCCWILCSSKFGVVLRVSINAITSHEHIYQVIWARSLRSWKSILGRNFKKSLTTLMDFGIMKVWVSLGC